MKRKEDNGPFPKSIFPTSVFPRRIFPWMGGDDDEEEDDASSTEGKNGADNERIAP